MKVKYKVIYRVKVLRHFYDHSKKEWNPDFEDIKGSASSVISFRGKNASKKSKNHVEELMKKNHLGIIYQKYSYIKGKLYLDEYTFDK